MLRSQHVTPSSGLLIQMPGPGKRQKKFRSQNSQFPELLKARSRLYRSQILQVNTRWKALVEIYTMHSFAPFCTVLESNPKNQENHGEKRTWSNSGEKWPGEAHQQPQLATQYYLRARSEECLQI